MKIYVVTEGEYSDYHIVGVFSGKEKADMYCAAREGRYNDLRVEEYEMDSIAVRGDGRAPWSVSKTFWEDGKVEERSSVASDDAEEKFEVTEGIGGNSGEEGKVYTYDRKGQKCRHFEGVVLAKGESHALKILGEKTFMYNSTNPLKF